MAVAEPSEDSGMNAGRRIALIGPAPPFRGGIAQHTTLLHRALSHKGTVILVSYRRLYPGIVFPGSTQFDDSETTFDVPHERLVGPLNPWSWITTVRRLEETLPDIVIIQWWQPYFGFCLGVIARLLKWRTDAKIVFICHNLAPHDHHWWDRILSRFALSAADRILVHGERLLEQAADLAPRAICVSHLHPLYEQFCLTGCTKAQAKSRLGIDKDIVLFFGLIRPYKGLDVLLKAMPAILETRDIHLVIAGEFYDPISKYRSLIDVLGLEANVTVIDRYIPNEEVEPYFAACDLVVCPYKSGSQSGIVQIAYAFDKPVICTDVGGLPDSVIDGKTGYVARPDNPDELAKCVLKFYASDEKFAEHIKGFKTRFDWDSLADALMTEPG